MKSLSHISIQAAAATIAVAMLTVVTACGPRGGGEIPVLDVTASYPAKNIILQDIAEVEYIPLETREGFLIDEFFNVKFVDDEIAIATNRAGDIMTFDRKTGKGLRSFNRTGRGPGEYTRVGSVVVDKRAGEMFVTSSQYSSGEPFPMYIYDMAGKHLRTVEFSDAAYTRDFQDYDTDHLLGYNLVMTRFTEDAPLPNPRPYALISKRDTVVTPLPVNFVGRESMMVVSTLEGGMMVATSAATYPMTRTRYGWVLSDPGVDTLWRWEGDSERLTPLITRTPSFGSMSYPITVHCVGESRDYIFLLTIERRAERGSDRNFERKYVIYDKRTGEFGEGRPTNADFTSERQFEIKPTAGLPAGVFVEALQSLELLELHEQGKLTGRLAEIAAGLKEDDNPVMMIVTFK